MAKEAYYFSHDSNARNDTKILSMRCDYGLEGYAMYFIIVECMREEENYKLKLEDNTYRALAMQMHCKIDTVEKFINDCINVYHLFQCDEHSFWSDSLLKRMGKMNDIRKKRKLAAAKRWDSSPCAMQEDSKCNANAEQNHPKEKKRKENKDIYIVDSEYLWGLYPEKKGKAAAMKNLPKLIKEYSKEQIERTIQRYMKDVEAKRRNGFPELNYKNGSTFFNSGYVDYLDENYKDSEKQEGYKPKISAYDADLIARVRAQQEAQNG